jgi:hypothetical protein
MAWTNQSSARSGNPLATDHGKVSSIKGKPSNWARADSGRAATLLATSPSAYVGGSDAGLSHPHPVVVARRLVVRGGHSWNRRMNRWKIAAPMTAPQGQCHQIDPTDRWSVRIVRQARIGGRHPETAGPRPEDPGHQPRRLDVLSGADARVPCEAYRGGEVLHVGIDTSKGPRRRTRRRRRDRARQAAR